MVEAVDAVSIEGEPSLRLFLLLQRGLRALDVEGRHPDLVTSFLLKLAEVIGVAPALDRCASCGGAAASARFSFSTGGAVCENCRTEASVRLRPGLTDYLAALAGAELDALPLADAAFSGEAMGITRRFVEYHLERRLASLAVLDE